MKLKTKIIIVISVILTITMVLGLMGYFFIVVPKREKKEEQIRLVKEYYDNKLAMYERENNEYDDYEVDVAFLGDSLTDGYDLENYYPEFVVSNRGIGGETTFGLENRLKVSVYDLKPKVVVMLIGGNNLNNMFDNYENILMGLKDNLPESKIVLLSLTAMGRDWGHKNQIACINNVKIKLLADKYSFSYIDLFSPLYNIDTGEIYEEYTADGAHLTSEGYEVVTKNIKPVLSNLLG